jgi:DNA polymerase-1
MQRDTILLIDISNMTHRHYNVLRRALPEGTEPDPKAVGQAVVGEAQRRAAYLHASDTIGVFDGAQGTARRRALFPGYKLKSGTHSEVLGLTFDYLRTVLPARGVRVEQRTEAEADDVLATLARQGKSRGLDTVVLSNDKDLFQVIDRLVSCLVPGLSGKPDRRWSLGEFVAEYSFHPCLVPHWKALQGDDSDTIPGVPGIGVGYASMLVRQHGTLGNIYHSLGDVKPEKLRPLLEAGKDIAFRNLTLVTLDDELPDVPLY